MGPRGRWPGPSQAQAEATGLFLHPQVTAGTHVEGAPACTCGRPPMAGIEFMLGMEFIGPCSNCVESRPCGAATLLGSPPGWKPLCKDAADIGGAPMATPANRRGFSRDAGTALINPQSHITDYLSNEGDLGWRRTKSIIARTFGMHAHIYIYIQCIYMYSIYTRCSSHLRIYGGNLT